MRSPTPPPTFGPPSKPVTLSSARCPSLRPSASTPTLSSPSPPPSPRKSSGTRWPPNNGLGTVTILSRPATPSLSYLSFASCSALSADGWAIVLGLGSVFGSCQALSSKLPSLLRLDFALGELVRLFLAFVVGVCLISCFTDQSSFADARGGDFTNWGNPLGFCAIGFASAAMGLQAHAGVRIGNIFNS